MMRTCAECDSLRGRLRLAEAVYTARRIEGARMTDLERLAMQIEKVERALAAHTCPP